MTGDSVAPVEGGGRSLPNVTCLESGHREAYDAEPQNSNGTTMGQVMAAGHQSAQPEGALLFSM